MLPLTLMQWVAIKLYADAEFLCLAMLGSHVPVNTHRGQHIHSSTHTEYCHDINGKRVLDV